MCLDFIFISIRIFIHESSFFLISGDWTTHDSQYSWKMPCSVLRSDLLCCLGDYIYCWECNWGRLHAGHSSLPLYYLYDTGSSFLGEIIGHCKKCESKVLMYPLVNFFFHSAYQTNVSASTKPQQLTRNLCIIARPKQMKSILIAYKQSISMSKA